MAVPRPLAEVGVDSDGWKGLALAALDFVFRNYLAIDLTDWLVPLISPKFGALNFVVPAGTPSAERRTSNTRPWPGPVPPARPTRLHRLVYGLIGGSWEDTVDQDRAAEVLDALWNLISYRSRGGASRELHLAIREYAPGAEVVIDGLVYESEGVLPAWGADADASRLEDLRDMWICRDCHAFEQASVRPAACPVCEGLSLEHRRVMRPAGFLSRKRPHTGYEKIAHVPLEPVRISAQGADWIALPHEEAGRIRADAAGQVATSAAGPRGGGYAICLDCGRAAPMGPPKHDTAEPLPEAIRRHRPLHRGKSTKLTRDGLCAGSDAPHRIQRHVHLAQLTRTDVWEWQLPSKTAEATARALAAGLREALCERMGVEPAEIGVAAGRSRGLAGEARISAFLYDRAAGGAGLAARMAEPEMLAATIERAVELLNCPEDCLRGCPACILRPDINQRDIALDRRGALDLARGLKARLNLPQELRLFGPETRLLGRPLDTEIERWIAAERLVALEVWLHGAPESWDFGGWPVARMLPRLGQKGSAVTVHIPKAALEHFRINLARSRSL